MVKVQSAAVAKKLLLLVGEILLAGYLKVWVIGRWCRTQASNDNAQGVIQYTVYEASVNAATPDWYAVFSCGLGESQDTCTQCFGTSNLS